MKGAGIILAVMQKKVKVKYRNTNYFAEPLKKFHIEFALTPLQKRRT